MNRDPSSNKDGVLDNAHITAAYVTRQLSQNYCSVTKVADDFLGYKKQIEKQRAQR
jgi:hypothetical protein